MENENNIYCKFTYKCGVCGKEYSNVQERMNCEMACVKKQQEEAKKAAEEKKNEEKKVRKAEVDAAFVNLYKLVEAYVRDFGHYEYGDSNDEVNFYWPSRLWNSFWN